MTPAHGMAQRAAGRCEASSFGPAAIGNENYDAIVQERTRRIQAAEGATALVLQQTVEAPRLTKS